MRKTCFILFFLLTLGLSAQVFVPSAETAFEPQHSFNPFFIKSRGVKKITLEIIDKKDFEVAVDRNLTETYEFNADGLLSRYYYTTIVRSIERQITTRNRRGVAHTRTVSDYLYDTVSTTFYYSGKNLVLRRYHDGMNYYEARYYRYDSLGNLTKEQRFRETNNSPDRSVFILGNQLLLSEDSFQYRKFSSGQLKCVHLNSENRPYKELITNYDSLGRKTNMTENYTAAAWIMQGTRFEYKGKHLVTAVFDGNAGTRVLLKNTYEYDEIEELYSEKQYKNDVLVKEISYVTDKTDSLLKSVIVRDTLNKTMRIIRLKYDTGQVSKGF